MQYLKGALQRFKRNLFVFVAYGGMMVSYVCDIAWAAVHDHLPYGSVSVSHPVYWWHRVLCYGCVATGCVIFGLMYYTTIKHYRVNQEGQQPFHGRLAIELMWMMVPLVIVAAMVVPMMLAMMHHA